MTGTALLLALQVASPGAIEGRVTTGDAGTPVEAARIRIEALGIADTTGADGAFRLAPLEEGRWSVSVEAAGLVPAALFVRVPEGETVRLDLRLDSVSDTLYLAGQVVDQQSGAGVPAAEVTGSEGVSSVANGTGEFRLQHVEGSMRLTVRAFGYTPLDTTVAPAPGELIRIPLVPRPFDLSPLTVRGRPADAGLEIERALFDREPMPGVVGLSGDELRGLPFMVERDILRSLQSLPGVVQINDLSARLHVRGGAPDQNMFLLDDAPVLGPYHLFGMFGTLDPGTVHRVEFYRGFLPARYGGALSSVIEVQQRTDSEGDSPDVDAGIGFLSARGMARGSALDGRIRWMASARRTVTDLAMERLGLVAEEAPFSFRDGQARVEFTPTASDQVRASVYGSDDDFTMFLDGASPDLKSGWRNRVASLRWDRELQGDWYVNTLARHTGYHGMIRVGGLEGSPVTTNEVRVRALSVELRRRGAVTGFRVGAEAEATRADVDGGGVVGGYVEGRSTNDRFVPSAWTELEHWLGTVRLTSGLRVTMDGSEANRLLVAPRLGTRVEVSDGIFLTAGVGRTHQALSTLRDDRYPLPGAPFWFLRDNDAPVTIADQASISLDTWNGGVWSLTATAWARRFQAVPSWRPEGVREPTTVEWHDGDAWGAEFMARRYADGVHGWAAYGFGHTRLQDSDGAYEPAWDRRHSLDVAAFWEADERWTVSTRLAYGSGTPFWPQSGQGRAIWIDPRTGDLNHREDFPIWSDEQQRFPSYFRADVGVKADFRHGGISIKPHASVVNLTRRENVLFYQYELGGPPADDPLPRPARLVPFGQIGFTLLPIVGIDVSF